MSDNPKDKATRPHGKHGTPSEVSWDGGAGRQPYANQGAEEAEQTGGGDEFPGGDRGELSGRNLAQQDAVRGKP